MRHLKMWQRNMILSNRVVDKDDIGHIRKQVEQIVEYLYGFGALGMVTRVGLMEARTGAHSKNWCSLMEMIIRVMTKCRCIWIGNDRIGLLPGLMMAVKMWVPLKQA